MKTHPDRRRRRLLALTLVGALAASSCGGSGAAELERVGGGDPLVLDDVQGPALVNVWATWCVPCKKELPDLQAVADDPSSGVTVIGVNVGDDLDSIEEFLTTLDVRFVNYTDPDGVVQTEFAIANLPATIAVRADGSIAEVYQGPLDEEGFRELAAQAVTEITNS